MNMTLPKVLKFSPLLLAGTGVPGFTAAEEVKEPANEAETTTLVQKEHRGQGNSLAGVITGETASLEQVVEQAKKLLPELEKVVINARQKEEQAAEAVAAQEKIVAAKQKDVDAKQKDVDAKQKDVDAKQKDVDALAKSIADDEANLETLKALLPAAD